MKRTPLTLSIATLLATVFLWPQPAAAGDPDDVLVVRYACLIGGREAGSAPVSAAVLSPKELHDFLLEWEPEADNEEVRQVFALNGLGELARQASQVPLAGGAVSGAYPRGDAIFEINMAIRPQRLDPNGESVIKISAAIHRNGKLLSMPTIFAPLGERAIISTANGPEAPFLFLVVEVDRVSREELRQRGLRLSWHKGYYLVDGDEVTAPVAIEKTQPQYTTMAWEAGVKGKVILRLLIDDEGTLEDVEVIEGQPYGLNDQAVKAVRRWRFKPALRHGKPVPVVYIVTINFQRE
jgi:TonB family protein